MDVINIQPINKDMYVIGFYESKRSKEALSKVLLDGMIYYIPASVLKPVMDVVELRNYGLLIN